MRRFVLFACLAPLALTAACAGPRQTAGQPVEYVEVMNPAYTMTPSAPETIWVPKKSTEWGIPRGSEVVKSGYEAIKSEVTQVQSPGASASEAR
ncbi:hypothetical protein EG829_16455 [bacterium]|nr:hypothetical protein [bacterium]